VFVAAEEFEETLRDRLCPECLRLPPAPDADDEDR
jgi:hypothetical protein